MTERRDAISLAVPCTEVPSDADSNDGCADGSYTKRPRQVAHWKSEDGEEKQDRLIGGAMRKGQADDDSSSDDDERLDF